MSLAKPDTVWLKDLTKSPLPPSVKEPRGYKPYHQAAAEQEAENKRKETQTLREDRIARRMRREAREYARDEFLYRRALARGACAYGYGYGYRWW